MLFLKKIANNSLVLRNKLKKIASLIEKKDKKKLWLVYFGEIFKSFLDFAGIGIILPLLVALLKPSLINQNETVKYLLENYSPFRGDDLLIISGIFIIVVYVLKNIYTFYFNIFKEKFFFFLQNNLSVHLFKNYLYAPYEFYINQKKATLLENIGVEVHNVIHHIFAPILLFISHSLTIIFTLAFLFILDFYSFSILSGTMGLSIYFFIKVSKAKIKSTAKKTQVNRREKGNYLLQALGVFKETKILGKENFFLHEIIKLNEKITHLELRISKINILRNIFFETVLIVITVFIIIFMLLNNQESEDIVIKMSVFALAAIRILPIALHITAIYNQVFANQVSLDVVMQEINALEKLSLKDDTKIKNFRKKITFKKIFFKYKNTNKFILKGLNLEIKKGERVAFVGVSGAGKTTIVDIIIGLLKPTKGDILIDGVSIIHKNDVWSYKIGYIPQDIYITNDTIAKNIAFGHKAEDIDKKRVMRVLKQAQLDSFIKKLPEGINSFIGENGVKVSGGQRQRIGIARSLYHDPQILIMDEATAALDNKTEKQFINTLKNIQRDITIVMIAHRLSTVENCDKVFFIHQGKIKAQSKLDELKKNTLFKQEVLGELA